MQDTLVQRLRDRAYSSKVPDPLVEEAANEIERLRLTDEERAALHWFAHYGLPEHRAAALRGLLERLA